MNEFSYVERFIKAVHRRMVVLRAAERLGICVVGACAVLLILMPILIWRGQETGQLALVTFGMAALAGIAWAVALRPTRLVAASEADRQLKLSDLLGTALLLRQTGARGDMEQTVLALAEAKSAQASPSAVVLHRFGARGWSGIGLAAALVGGMCLMGPDNAKSQARAEGPKSWQEVELENDKTNATKIASKPDMRRMQAGNGTDETDPLKSNVASPDPIASAAQAVKNPNSHNDDSGTQAGGGAGASQSASKTHSQAAADPSTSANSRATDHGDTAGGGGTSENGNGNGASGGTAGGGKTRKAAPVWRSDNWPADQAAARSALQSGQIPDAYRDLVRDYFERE